MAFSRKDPDVGDGLSDGDRRGSIRWDCLLPKHLQVEAGGSGQRRYRMVRISTAGCQGFVVGCLAEETLAAGAGHAWLWQALPFFSIISALLIAIRLHS